MPSISSLILKLTKDYPEINFIEAEQFSWSPSTKTVSYSLQENQAESNLLHEVSHAILEHSNYHRDVELLAMEAEAWDKAEEIAGDYKVTLDEDEIQNSLDTYRQWLHARSTCPECTATGVQVKELTYECPACTNTWRVNEARLCGLKRYQIKHPS